MKEVIGPELKTTTRCCFFSYLSKNILTLFLLRILFFLFFVISFKFYWSNFNFLDKKKKRIENGVKRWNHTAKSLLNKGKKELSGRSSFIVSYKSKKKKLCIWFCATHLHWKARCNNNRLWSVRIEEFFFCSTLRFKKKISGLLTIKSKDSSFSMDFEFFRVKIRKTSSRVSFLSPEKNEPFTGILG